MTALARRDLNWDDSTLYNEASTGRAKTTHAGGPHSNILPPESESAGLPNTQGPTQPPTYSPTSFRKPPLDEITTRGTASGRKHTAPTPARVAVEITQSAGATGYTSPGPKRTAPVY